MTPRTWAEQKVEDLWYRGHQHVDDMSKLLASEHARSVRIVKRYIKHMAGATLYEWERGYQSACNDILAALQRGRTGRGK